MAMVTNTLKEEHEGILKMLSVAETLARRLDQGESVSQGDLRNVLEFFQTFVGESHDGKENTILFPALIDKGALCNSNLLRSLLKEHKKGWSLLRRLDDATYSVQFHAEGLAHRWAKAARNYVEFMRHHIEEEDQVLLPEAERLLGPGDQQALSDKFERFEAERIGLPTHERMHQMIEEMAGKLAA